MLRLRLFSFILVMIMSGTWLSASGYETIDFDENNIATKIPSNTRFPMKKAIIEVMRLVAPGYTMSNAQRKKCIQALVYGYEERLEDRTDIWWDLYPLTVTMIHDVYLLLSSLRTAEGCFSKDAIAQIQQFISDRRP